MGVNYRSDSDSAEAVVKEITDAGGRALAVQADIADPDAADTLFKALEEEFGPVLVLVNNAGVRADGLSPQIDDDDWDKVIDTNLSAAFRLTRRALRPMIRNRYGRVVNIASIVGAERANPGQANYAASKAGLVAMTKTVAAEVARRGVTVNAVAPGLIETDMTEGHRRRAARARARPPGRHPGRGGRLRALPRLGRRRVRDRRLPDRRRRTDRLTHEPRRRTNGSHSNHVRRSSTGCSRRSRSSAPSPIRSRPDAEFEALDVDSLDLVELAQIVEDEYGVQLKGEDMEGIKTVRQAVDLVTSKLG